MALRTPRPPSENVCRLAMLDLAKMLGVAEHVPKGQRGSPSGEWEELCKRIKATVILMKAELHARKTAKRSG